LKEGEEPVIDYVAPDGGNTEVPPPSNDNANTKQGNTGVQTAADTGGEEEMAQFLLQIRFPV
jgi:hypothetical protein